MRKVIFLSVKIFISVVLMLFVLQRVNFGALVLRLDLRSVGWIALAVLAATCQIILGALRWRRISRECGAPLTTTQVMRFSFIGSFFNQTLPSSIGGDAVRIWLVRRGNTGWRPAAYSVFIDRATGLIALAIIVVVTLPWSYQLIHDQSGRWALVLIDLAALAGAAGFLVLGRLPWPWLNIRWQTRDLFACSVIANRLLFVLRTGPTIAALSLFVHVLSVIITWCVVRSIGAPVAFFQIVQLIPPVILLTMLPISIAGWGVREASMGLAFGYADLTSSEGVSVSLLFGAVTFLVGALGGIAWIFSPEASTAANVSPPHR